MLTSLLLAFRFFKKKIGYIPEHDSTLTAIRPDFEVSLQTIECAKQAGSRPSVALACLLVFQVCLAWESSSSAAILHAGYIDQP